MKKLLTLILLIFLIFSTVVLASDHYYHNSYDPYGIYTYPRDKLNYYGYAPYDNLGAVGGYDRDGVYNPSFLRRDFVNQRYARSSLVRIPYYGLTYYHEVEYLNIQRQPYIIHKPYYPYYGY